ncbi:Pecanex-like protein 1 [Actinoplanes sp. KI2]|uniref:Pecanex-like protein 1 n=1 Tax=Actinoplanes sp. KI2 TaxID=2983315 RepID=UPI0021D585AE|nr:Pecanex-like protein 1 [Actinoplanes sp. KI2]MCU7725898.1 Pecanex-like protein 1 [Actinoplanes sp. KI2]
MRRSKYRRASSRNSGWFSGRRRIIAVAATLVAFGGIVTVTQVSNASTNRTQKKALSACDNVQAPPTAKLSTKTRRGTYTTNNGTVVQHPDDGAGDTVTTAQLRDRCRRWVMNNVGNNGNATTAPTAAATTAATTAPAADPSADPSASGDAGNNNGGNNNGGNNNGGNNGGNNNGGNNGGQQTTAPAPDPSASNGATTPPPGAGLGVLTNNCSTSQLPQHDGFQKGDRCVTTEFGEVASENNNASLLITQAPRSVAVNTPFTLQVSTRNLIRDRFLAAGAGGYYVESSVLANGITRGHFHTACRMLANTNEAPDPAPVPAFFVATEDKKGGAAPDVVTIQVPGMPTTGIAQCASWAGDGSHRIPMMQRANQTPAFDAVKILVR